MKLKEFVDNLNNLMRERPETAEFDVVTSIDDEGNGYNLVYYCRDDCLPGSAERKGGKGNRGKGRTFRRNQAAGKL